MLLSIPITQTILKMPNYRRKGRARNCEQNSAPFRSNATTVGPSGSDGRNRTDNLLITSLQTYIVYNTGNHLIS